jgi:uncharacterized protein YcfL
MTKRLFVLLPALLLGACAGYYQHQSDDPKDVLKLDDPRLNTEISVHTVQKRWAGSLLTVQVVVHNDSLIRHRYRYRLQWLDSSGVDVNPDGTGSGWQPLVLQGDEDYTIVGTAPSAAAKKFHVEFGDQ